MNELIEKVKNVVSDRKVMIMALGVFIFIQFIIAGALVINTMVYDKIYKGVYINNVYVSGLTTKEAKSFLEETYQKRLNEMVLTINLNGEKEKIKPIELVSSLKYDEAVEKAYNSGREGNIFSRAINILHTSSNEKIIGIESEFDEGKLQQLIGKYYFRVKKDLVENTYQIYEDKIVITKGSTGYTLDEASLRKLLADRVENLRINEIDLPIVKTNPQPLDIDAIHKKIYTTAADATYKVEQHKMNIIPEVVGRDFDTEAAKEKLNAQTAEGSSIEIPLNLTYPKLSAEELQKTLFKDTISSFTTKYNQGDSERSENIRLAAGSINDVVLAPGDVFSYNQVVGERSADRGYKMAHVYVGTRITEGLGGGICQVSTTLYNAVLFADLQVVSRRNHNMTVKYVPPGRDATVSYGSTDFQFKNNYKNPIKILVTPGRGRLSVEILGVVENPSKKIELETEILAKYPYKETITEDPTKPVGYYKVEQSGMNGYKVNTYKIVKIDGKTVSRTLITTSRYNALNLRAVKGTKIE